MVEEKKKETQNLQEQFKSTTFKHLPKIDTNYKQAMKSKNEWLIKITKEKVKKGKGRVIVSPIESPFC